MEAVKRWKFKPAMKDGRPVAVYYTLTVSYTMGGPSTFGPLLSKFMKENRDFWDLVTHQRFEEALALLDSRGAGPEVRLARAYVLSSLRRLDEAWEEAQAYDGPEPYEVFQQVALSALSAVAGTRDPKVRAGFLEVGLQAATRAMEAREDDRKAMITKSQLLREKSKTAVDPQQRAALLQEADEIAKRAGVAP